MYYVYVIISKKTGKCYIGFTADLNKRFYQHNSKYSLATKAGAPWKLIYYEAYLVKAHAQERERKLKQYGQSWRRLKERLALAE